eukprot:jgi/Ulvmu1/9026/UM005_0118.1
MSIILYNQPNFEGRTTELGTASDGLRDNSNNKASSAKVIETPWLLYTGSDFKGTVSILKPGNYADPAAMGLSNNTLTSLRPFPIPATNSILLFEDFDFKGRMVHLTGPTDDLREVGFNDRASSAIVLTGTWLMYNSANFNGEPFPLPPGDYPRAGGNDILTSARPTSPTAP